MMSFSSLKTNFIQNIKKRYKRGVSVAIGILAIAACTTSLTACHGSKKLSDFDMPEEFDTSQQIEIVFWAKNDNNVKQSGIYKKAAEDFHKLYPNVTVTIRLYTDYGKIYNDVITNIPTGTTPNLCITYPDHIATYLTSENQVLQLDELMKNKKYGLGGKEVLFDSVPLNEVEEKYLNECKLNGSYYALPFMRSTEALYINKTFVEKLGYEVPDVVTWDYIWEISEAALEQDSDGNYLINGQNVLIPFIYKSTDNMMIQRLYQLGADYTDDNGNIYLFNDTARMIMSESAEHGKTRAFSTFQISSYPGNFLNAGQCIFAVDSTAGSTWIGPNAPLSDIHKEDIAADIEVVVRPIPQADVENISMISQGPSICLFNKGDSQVNLATWLFAQYLLTDEVQIAYAETEGYVPVTKAAKQTSEYQDYLSKAGLDNDQYYDIKIEATKLLLNNIDNTFITSVFNGSASVRNAAGQLIESSVKSARNNKTVDDAYIDYIFDGVNSLFRLDQIGASTNSSSEINRDLGPLPVGAKILIGSLLVIWSFLGIYFLVGFLKKKRKQ